MIPVLLLTCSSSYGSFANNFGLAKQPPSANDAKPDDKPAPVSQALQKPQASTSGSGHGGSRTEPPKRLYEVEGLQLATPSLDEIAAGYAT